MNQREKILAYSVFGLLLAIGLQYGISGYQSALQDRKRKLSTIEETVSDQEFEEMVGQQAMEQWHRYRKRSLPSNSEAAQSQYKERLETLIGSSGLDDWSVDYVGDQGSNRLYRVYTFRVAGIGNIKQVGEVVQAFHEMNYLQRTKKLMLRRSGDKGDLLMNLDVEAVALLDAAKDQPPPSDPDPRIGDDAEAYLTSIVNRNMFSPPNNGPRYSGSGTLQAYLERDFSARLKFDDQDGDRVDIDVVGQLPPGFQLNRGEIIGRAKEKGEYTFVVKAWDSGLPSRVIEQKLQLSVGDPPVEEAPKGPPKFDESRQAILTGLVQSRGQWSAWINVRTKNLLLKLKAGDDFEVGSVSGKIVEVTDRYAVFESDGENYTLQQDNSLADAKTAAIN